MMTIPAPELPRQGRAQLETTHRAARAASHRDEAVARAARFLEELKAVWQRRLGPVLEIAWPVYAPEHPGPLLDAVAGTALPELQLP